MRNTRKKSSKLQLKIIAKKPMNSQKQSLFWGNGEGWESRLVKANPSKKSKKS